ncbi:MAG: HAD family hydrolase [Gammaproteobacteria bacterium]|nr:HAD family hydrolase [Gammaproteobacteria bacterium]
MAIKAAFLDRDGTINVDQGYVHRREDWQFTDRAIEALSLLRDYGFVIAVVTNQSGIARGFYSAEDVAALHEYVQQQCLRAGTRIDAFAICPHLPEDGCSCRKPGTGMARRVAQAVGVEIDYASSWAVGDKVSDMQFGQALGARTALIRSGYWRTEDGDGSANLIGGSLYELATRIVTA